MKSAPTGAWACYDVDGNRVPPKSTLAAFKAQPVLVDSRVSAPPNHASLGRFEYIAYPIGRPDLQRTFKSFRRMLIWFKEARSTTATGRGKR